MANSVEQMGLAQAHAAMNEERIVGGAGRFTDCQATGVCKSVAGPHDEMFEAIIAIEAEQRRVLLEGEGRTRGRWVGVRRVGIIRDAESDSEEPASDGLGGLRKGSMAVLSEIGELVSVGSQDG